MYKIIIQNIPPSKKNSKQIYRNKYTGKPFITSSKNQKEWEKIEFLNLAKWKNINNFCEIFSKCSISMVFHVKGKRKFDLDNKSTTVLDLLVKCEIIKDDNWEVVPELSLKYQKSDTNYTEILIKKLQ